MRIIDHEQRQLQQMDAINTVRSAMRNQPIKLEFIMPRHASPAAKANYRRLRKLISQNNTIQMQLSPSKENDGQFVAYISFREIENEQRSAELKDSDLACESEIRAAVQEFLSNALARTMKPSQCVYAVMSILNKPVVLKSFCQVCFETLKLSPETIRGTFNKKRNLYISPKHG